MSRVEWLAQLKTGDEVAIPCGWSKDNYQTYKVSGVTPKFVVVSGSKYKRSDGQLVGGRYADRIYPVTQEIKDTMRLHELRWRLCQAFDHVSDALKKIPLADLEAINTIVTEALKEDEHATG